MRFLLNLVITALAVLLAARFVPGIEVSSFWAALLAALVLGILNATVGIFLKIVTFPLSIATLGLFLLVVNALIFWMASFVKGFEVAGFGPAFWGALLVTIVTMTSRALVRRAS